MDEISQKNENSVEKIPNRFKLARFVKVTWFNVYDSKLLHKIKIQFSYTPFKHFDNRLKYCFTLIRITSYIMFFSLQPVILSKIRQVG